jgi:hypothetical protein
MCKWQRMIPRPQRSPRYRIVNGWKNEYGSWSWSPWKILKQLENRWRLLLLYFFSFSYFPLFFFFYFWHVRYLDFFIFYFVLLSYSFFISPRTLICIVPTSSPMLRRLLVLEQRGSGVKVDTGCLMRGNLNLPFEAPSCDVSSPYSSDR